MKTIILLRHAKSSWADGTLDDHDRPLNARGRTAAPLIARWLDARGYCPDIILCSSAVRTRETLGRMHDAVPSLPDATVEPALYHAMPEAMLARLRHLPDSAGTAMVIAHEPGLSTLARRLDNGRAPADCAHAFQHFPTAAAAVMTFDVESWGEVAPGRGSFTAFAVPRDLA